MCGVSIVVLWFIVRSIKYYGVNVHIFLYLEEFQYISGNFDSAVELGMPVYGNSSKVF